MINIRPGVMFLPVIHKDLSLVPFCFLFISMIYLMVFSVSQNCCHTMPHYLYLYISKATNDLNNDLTKITKWVFQERMSFNPDISKQAHEVIFSRKLQNVLPRLALLAIYKSCLRAHLDLWRYNI